MKGKTMKKKMIFAIGVLLAVMLCGCSIAGRRTSFSSAEEENEADAGPQQNDEEAEVKVKGNEVKETDEILVTVTEHPLSCKNDEGNVLAEGYYPELTLSEETAKKYPKLAGALDNVNEQWSTSVRKTLSGYGYYRTEDDYTDPEYPYACDMTAQILRFDDNMFTVLLTYYDFAGGAHPSHSTGALNIDPVTGSALSLKDVLADTENAPRIIREALYDQYADLVEEIESFAFFDDGEDSMDDIFRNKLEEDAFTWSVTDEGLWIYFSPYEIASYAAGHIDVNLKYDEYAGLVQPQYEVKEKQDIKKIVKTDSAGEEVISPEEPEEEGGAYSVSNPTWNSFHDSSREKADAEHISLRKMTEDRSSWLDTGRWASENGFEIARMPYSDENYTYEATSPVEYDYMYNELLIYDRKTEELLYDLDLYTLINGPDDEEGRVSETTQYIRWAQLYDGVIYVSVGHNGYAFVEPRSSYIVAIDADTLGTIWRSDALVSNALNFKIVDDTIICGYGFTAEDDYIYLLDRYTGETEDRIKVRTGPDQFEVVGSTLYAATYDTAYTFSIER